MRNRTIFLPITALSLAMTTGSALALPFDSPDPRSFAMGGAGVASGTSANAIFLNPALLAAHRDSDRFSLELPVIAGRLREQEDVIDAIEEFDDNNPMARFENAVINYNPANPGSVNEVTDSGQALISSLDSISDKLLQIEGNAAIVVGIPSKRLGISVFAHSFVLGGALGNFSDEDRQLIQQVMDAASVGEAIDIDTVDAFTSTMNGRFALITEIGAGIAHKFDQLGGISLGVTPKLLKVDTYDYIFVGDDIDDVEIDLDQAERSDTDVNFDIGVAKDFGGGWQAGLSIKNLIPREYSTAADNKIKLDPMVRIGMAFRPPMMEWITVATDVDLTESEPAGLDSKTQYVGLGVEFEAARIMQFRFGYRHNLSSVPADIDSDMFSAGFGISPLGIHIDAAVAGNSEDIGAALQLGFRF